MPEGNPVACLGIKRQRISNEQKMFKELGSNVYTAA
jgi:hypothetical protein